MECDNNLQFIIAFHFYNTTLVFWSSEQNITFNITLPSSVTLKVASTIRNLESGNLSISETTGVRL